MNFLRELKDFWIVYRYYRHWFYKEFMNRKVPKDKVRVVERIEIDYHREHDWRRHFRLLMIVLKHFEYVKRQRCHIFANQVFCYCQFTIMDKVMGENICRHSEEIASRQKEK